MGHIEDRWFNTVTRPDGSTHQVKTKLYGIGMRYRVRFEDPNTGRERKKSFPDRAKRAAQDYLISVESDKRRGTYIDPAAGQILFRDYAETWLRTRRFDPSTRESMEIRVRRHLYPFFGHRQLAAIRPGHIREWDTQLVDVIGSATRAVTFAHLRSIFSAAVDDERIGKNPCSAKSVDPPRPDERKVVPWTLEQVRAVRAAIPARYQPMVDLGSGCGLRQGEIFGLAAEDIDFVNGWLHIRRQVKRVRSRLVFGLPKNNKDRRIPLADAIAEILAQHIADVPPLAVTLPWEDPASDRRETVVLLFTTTRKNAINRSDFNPDFWHPAVAAAGLGRSRDNGMHALRHFYASALLDAGETVKALAAYLGHADPGFTLRTYTHLMPASEERTRAAIDALFGPRKDPQTPWRRPTRVRRHYLRRSRPGRGT
ncbi:site-specific integrase [Actinoplanes hulinensis]|uniref:Site-specific integrase n=1 Tax=Actinoplanes hulinensis TaxID=1144547 RepID=A0ABS7B6X0_9ACTN|nr:site-specific integrase [Actinoplanes hulinensis]MBW6436700.1 site-specific integrase [Actinoplanes hulinensis]